MAIFSSSIYGLGKNRDFVISISTRHEATLPYRKTVEKITAPGGYPKKIDAGRVKLG